LKGARRLITDPSIGVADLMGPLESIMASEGSRDLMALIGPPKGCTSWKTTPSPTWLSNTSDVALDYFDLAPNGMLPPKKNKVALEKIDAGGKANYTKNDRATWAEDLDEIIRTILRHFREMKKYTEVRERYFKQASPAEKRKINEVLKKVVVSDEVDLGLVPKSPKSWEAGEASEIPKSRVASSEKAAMSPLTTALVLAPEVESKPPEVSPTRSASAPARRAREGVPTIRIHPGDPSKMAETALDIFSKMLKPAESEESSAEASPPPKVGPKVEPKVEPSAPLQKPHFLALMMANQQYSTEEQDLLLAGAETPALNSKGSTQLQRLRKARASLGLGKPGRKRKAMDDDHVANSPKNERKMSKTTVKKRPASRATVTSDSVDSACVPATPTGPTTSVASASASKENASSLKTRDRKPRRKTWFEDKVKTMSEKNQLFLALVSDRKWARMKMVYPRKPKPEPPNPRERSPVTC